MAWGDVSSGQLHSNNEGTPKWQNAAHRLVERLGEQACLYSFANMVYSSLVLQALPHVVGMDVHQVTWQSYCLFG